MFGTIGALAGKALGGELGRKIGFVAGSVIDIIIHI